jgi:hypothetical protein
MLIAHGTGLDSYKELCIGGRLVKLDIDTTYTEKDIGLTINKHRRKQSVYVRLNKGTRGLLHRAILGITDPRVHVDHINGDTLDNRSKNLRVCTLADNNRNRGKHGDGLWAFKGVMFKNDTPRKRRWGAQICYNRRGLKLGTYYTINEAAYAYNIAAKKLFKEFAFLNDVPEVPWVESNVNRILNAKGITCL